MKWDFTTLNDYCNYLTVVRIKHIMLLFSKAMETRNSIFVIVDWLDISLGSVNNSVLTVPCIHSKELDWSYWLILETFSWESGKLLRWVPHWDYKVDWFWPLAATFDNPEWVSQNCVGVRSVKVFYKLLFYFLNSFYSFFTATLFE